MPKDSWKPSRVKQQLKRLSTIPDLETAFHKNYREHGDKLIYVGKKARSKKLVKAKGWYGEFIPSGHQPTGNVSSQLHCDEMWVGVVPSGIKGVKVIANRQGIAMLDTLSIDGVPVEFGPTPDLGDTPVFKVMT